MSPQDVHHHLRRAKNGLVQANASMRLLLSAAQDDLEVQQCCNALSELEAADHAMDEYIHDYDLRQQRIETS